MKLLDGLHAAARDPRSRVRIEPQRDGPAVRECQTPGQHGGRFLAVVIPAQRVEPGDRIERGRFCVNHARYRLLGDWLVAAALPPEESVTFLAGLARQL